MWLPVYFLIIPLSRKLLTRKWYCVEKGTLYWRKPFISDQTFIYSWEVLNGYWNCLIQIRIWRYCTIYCLIKYRKLINWSNWWLIWLRILLTATGSHKQIIKPIFHNNGNSLQWSNSTFLHSEKGGRHFCHIRVPKNKYMTFIPS